MSNTVSVDQGTQQDGDQQPNSKKAKRDLETMEGTGEKEKEEERDKVDKARKTPAISEKYNSDDADISLISSDNVLFKVHSYRLMTASSIFRDLLSMPDSATREAPIYLTDEKMERSNVLKTLLDIMYTFEITVTGSDFYVVIDLAEKWDFAQVLHTIRRGLPHHDGSMFHRFQLAIKIKHPALIAGFLRRTFNFSWADNPDKATIDGFRKRSLVRQAYDEAAPSLLKEPFVGGSRTLDAATWSYGSFLLTPPTVLWALLRATYVGTTTPAEIDGDKVADEFERLLKLAYEPKKADVDKDKGDGGN